MDFMAHEYTLNTPHLFLNLQPKCLWLVFERLTSWQPQCLPPESFYSRSKYKPLSEKTGFLSVRFDTLDGSASHWSLTCHWCEGFQTRAARVTHDGRAVALCLGWRGKLSPCGIEQNLLNSALRLCHIQSVLVFHSGESSLCQHVCPTSELEHLSFWLSCYCGVLWLSLYVCSHKITSLLPHSWVIVILCNVTQRPGSLNCISLNTSETTFVFT